MFIGGNIGAGEHQGIVNSIAEVGNLIADRVENNWPTQYTH
jgi:hypothetical protein